MPAHQKGARNKRSSVSPGHNNPSLRCIFVTFAPSFPRRLFYPINVVDFVPRVCPTDSQHIEKPKYRMKIQYQDKSICKKDIRNRGERHARPPTNFRCFRHRRPHIHGLSSDQPPDTQMSKQLKKETNKTTDSPPVYPLYVPVHIYPSNL